MDNNPVSRHSTTLVTREMQIQTVPSLASRLLVGLQHLLTSVDNGVEKVGGSCIANKNDGTAVAEHLIVFKNTEQIFHM